jgi:hypothetical protein
VADTTKQTQWNSGLLVVTPCSFVVGYQRFAGTSTLKTEASQSRISYFHRRENLKSHLYCTEYRPLGTTRLWHFENMGVSHCKGKVKVNCPGTRHGGVWGGRSIPPTSYSFLTSALDGGEWSASRSGRALPPGKGPRYPLDRRLGGNQSRSRRRV